MSVCILQFLYLEYGALDVEINTSNSHGSGEVVKTFRNLKFELVSEVLNFC